ncbi:MAG: c-type cytochrome domain-containing protein [Planctomycetota bacterium]
MPDLIGFFGRFHPFLNHLPIGLLVGLLALEIVAHAIAAPLPRRVVTGLAWITAISAVLSALSGYTLSLESQYAGGAIETHRNLGLAVAAISVVLAIVHLRAREGTRETALQTYRVFLVIAVLLLIPAGHFGATITHGEGFLTAPLRKDATVAAAGRSAEGQEAGSKNALVFSRDVAPILSSRCSACHGATKKKGGLSLATRESILAGGEDGPVIVAGKPGDSEMIRRLRLPIDDEHHMPPDTKPQPTAAEIGAIAQWISEGAVFDDAAAAVPARVPPAPAPVQVPVEPPRASEEALAQLEKAQVHVEPISKDSHLLWIDFSASASATGDAEAAALLEPVIDFVADLTLSRSKVTDQTVKLAARMPNLARLDLRATGVTDAGVAALAGHPSLVELVMPQTRLTDGVVPHLLKIGELRKVYLWNSGVTIQGIAKLRLGREDLVIEAGDPGEARPLETEGKPVPAKPALSLSNTICPVTGKPIDPACQVVYEGRKIGFCCTNCLAAFLAEPAKYDSKPK